MMHKRCKLVSLWLTAALLTVAATGACVYQAARSAVLNSAQKSSNELSDAVGYRIEPSVDLRTVRFDSESWAVIEFEVVLKPGVNDPIAATWESAWGLHEWDIIVHDAYTHSCSWYR